MLVCDRSGGRPSDRTQITCRQFTGFWPRLAEENIHMWTIDIEQPVRDAMSPNVASEDMTPDFDFACRRRCLAGMVRCRERNNRWSSRNRKLRLRFERNICVRRLSLKTTVLWGKRDEPLS